MAACAECGAALPLEARFCPACAAPTDATPLSEERKLATVLFADLVGSTAFASGRDPERVSATLERFYDAMRSEIEGAGGTVRVYAGDAILAVFGVPVALEDHAERALHAALAMQRRLRELFGEQLALRIGVNSGELVVAKPRRGSSLVTGDTANIGARLEQAAEANEILVGDRTVSAVLGAFEFGESQTIAAKGKSAGVACRRLLRALTFMRPRGVSGLPPVFVGREAELAQLQSIYHRVCSSRRPELVTILGDAGVGKSRLLRELWQWLASEDEQPAQRTGRCLSYGQSTYGPLGEILREQLDLRETGRADSALERLRGREILGLALGLDVAADLHPLVARDRFQDAWAALLEALTAERPAVLLLEDVHWAEEPLLDLLDHLVASVQGPLLLIATARPEFLERRPGWGAGVAGATIALEALGDVETDRLLRTLLGDEPGELLCAAARQAEGNPFFLEELLASLIDQQLLRRENGGWSLAELPPSFAIPDSVQALVAARIDLLAPPEKAALEAAAVIGRIFWSGPLYELLEDLEPNLRLLERRDFILLRLGSSIEGEREYAIKHALIREVAYARIPAAKRARLHAAFARWLERFGGGRDEYAAVLAHHFGQAVRPEDADLAWAGEAAELRRLRAQAVSWLRRAAELAVSRYEIGAALALLERALELEPDELEKAHLWRLIGRANALRFDGEAFLAAMQCSLAFDRDPSSRADSYAELAFHTALRSGMWKTQPDPELVEGWVERALELAEPESRARARALAARAFWRPHAAEREALEASALADRLGDLELRSYAFAARAAAAFEQHRFAEAQTWTERRLELVGEIGDPDQAVEVYQFAVPTTAAVGRLQEARRLAAQHVETARTLSPHHRVHGLALTVDVEEMAADWEAIRELTPRAEAAVAANLATPCVRNVRLLLLCALASALTADEKQAQALERAADACGMEDYGFVLAAPRVRLALVRNDLEEVTRLLEGEVQVRHSAGPGSLAARLDGLAALRARERLETEAPPLLKPSTYVEPFALRALGIVRNDEKLIQQALGRFEAMALNWHADQTGRLLGQL